MAFPESTISKPIPGMSRISPWLETAQLVGKLKDIKERSISNEEAGGL